MTVVGITIIRMVRIPTTIRIRMQSEMVFHRGSRAGMQGFAGVRTARLKTLTQSPAPMVPVPGHGQVSQRRRRLHLAARRRRREGFQHGYAVCSLQTLCSMRCGPCWMQMPHENSCMSTKPFPRACAHGVCGELVFGDVSNSRSVSACGVGADFYTDPKVQAPNTAINK